MTIIPYAPVGRLIRSVGAERVSETASVALAEILEQYGLEIAEEAVVLTKHAKRKTVKAEDIILAMERL